MILVNRISRLRDCGIFRNFNWPSDLPDFGQYNVIYGWNGTGKTTISRLFRDLEVRRAPKIGEAVLRINGNEVPGEEFPQSDLNVRVFNRHFVEENVFPVEGGDLPPILVLGADNVEKQRVVQQLKLNRDSVLAKLDSTRSADKAARKALDQFCISRARSIKNELRTSGQNTYNNYNKTRFRRDAHDMAAAGDGMTHRLADVDRARLLGRHKGKPKPPIAHLSYTLPNVRAILDDVAQLLTTTVVSAAIDALKDDAALAEWTRQGLSLHSDRQADQCLFCDQSLPFRRLDELNAHFSAAYERVIESIDCQIARLRSASTASEAIQLPPPEVFYDHLVPRFHSGERRVRDALVSLRQFLTAAVDALESKKLRPFEGLKLELVTPPLDQDAVEALNEVIRDHNEECGAFRTRAQDARIRLAKDMIATGLDEYIRLRDTADSATVDHQRNRRDRKHLDADIGRLESEIVEHRRPAEDLNEDLRKYLGHSELCLEIKETGYSITRGGVAAGALSEGETTAIALLYFLKSLQDRRFELARGVVVLDDPVSSLDANALFLAFGFIRERTVNAGQLFILTHSFSLFRQIRNWFGHLKGQRKKTVRDRPARFLMLDVSEVGGVRSSSISGLDPLLAEYESEYHYLFARIYEAAKVATPRDLEENYSLPNMARRMLEAFLAFRQPHVGGGLWQKINEVSFDEAKKHRILRFLHTHSHSEALGEPEHDLTALAEGPSVLHDLLDMMKAEDAAHVAAMEDLVGRWSHGADVDV